MSEWWNNTTSRERILIVTAASLSVIIFVWFIIIVPSFSAMSAARQQLDLERSRLSKLESALQIKRMNLLTLTGEELKNQPVTGPLKATITETASEFGVQIARLQGGNQEAVAVFVDKVDPRLLYFWLDDLERNYGTEVTRLVVEQIGGNSVRVRFELEPKV